MIILINSQKHGLKDVQAEKEGGSSCVNRQNSFMNVVIAEVP